MNWFQQAMLIGALEEQNPENSMSEVSSVKSLYMETRVSLIRDKQNNKMPVATYVPASELSQHISPRIFSNRSATDMLLISTASTPTIRQTQRRPRLIALFSRLRDYENA
jgi:hypothetical protein